MKAKKTILRRRRSLPPPGILNLPLCDRASFVMRFFGLDLRDGNAGNRVRCRIHGEESSTNVHYAKEDLTRLELTDIRMQGVFEILGQRDWNVVQFWPLSRNRKPVFVKRSHSPVHVMIYRHCEPMPWQLGSKQNKLHKSSERLKTSNFPSSP